MSVVVTDPNAAAWQAHSLQRLNAEGPEPREIPNRMEWTRTPGQGPRAELLGHVDGRMVIELGCGAGHNIAHLVAMHGAIGTGLDVAWGQVQRARRNYGHLRGLLFTITDACTSLEYARRPFDVCYSVFGVVGLVPPLELFSLVAENLAPRGVLAFAVIHPDLAGQTPDAGDTPQPDSLQLPDGKQARILRYVPSRDGWLGLVEKTGLTVTDVLDIADSEGAPETLIVTARKA
ncbi:class I SAM-dependent methyltransferase [Catenulispora sp. NL8]|uniref:Class I SAM-dependent methyltransferase n=1 Tax=Catenulispora pinistramenti TaxID=2705254 RepID=A0ABS5L4Y3_9ACTN|nr:class I SAM-dependent methyltransferase [Catenulispora pinistramenti]MBS2553422.1 class I SAM-dependent methyltransferase [Catenulispora pinistramenti]